MSYEDRLVESLRAIAQLRKTGEGLYAVLPSSFADERHNEVTLSAPEIAVRAFVERSRVSALEALGTVNDDPTGESAALSLLATQIEEELFVDRIGLLTSITVAADGVYAVRS